MTHAERTIAALDLAQEATEITGTTYVAEIDYSGAERLPTYAVVDEIRGGFIVEDLTEEDVIVDVIETLDLAEAVAARPEDYHPDTRRAFGIETDEDREAREADEDAAAEAEQYLDGLAEIHAARELEARAEFAYHRDEALYGPSDPY